MASKLQEPGCAEDYTVDKIIKIVEDVLETVQIVEGLHTGRQNGAENTNSGEETAAGENISADAGTLRTAKSTGNKINNQGDSGTGTRTIRKHLTRTASAPPSGNRLDDAKSSTQKLRRNLGQLKDDVSKLKHLQNDVGMELEKHLEHLRGLVEEVQHSNDSGQTSRIKEIDETGRKIFNLMCRVPLLPDKRRKGGINSQNWANEGKTNIYLPSIYAKEDVLCSSMDFKEVIKKFWLLPFEQKFCLLTFAVFPENREVKRTMLMYWWIGEGILPIEKAEEEVKNILKKFSEKGLIEPVKERCKPAPTSYKMAPLVHSAVVFLSEKLDFLKLHGEKGKPTMAKSVKKRVCLVEGSSGQSEAKSKKMEPGDLETVFNASERFPDFTFKWYSEMKQLRVLYLGRWERTAKRHIEVDSLELMKNLKFMINLRFLSFQGISRIERLHGSICKLQKLTILDLRACYNLEELPEKIDLLKNLVYLDITDCYMLDRIPKKLSSLSKLEVLKGFVVSDADKETTCTPNELRHLQKLRKLSVNINQQDFSLDNLMKALVDLKALQSLKLAWGGRNRAPKMQKDDNKGKKAIAAAGSAKAQAGGKNQAKTSAETKATNLEKKDKNTEKSCVSTAGLKDTVKEKKDEKMENASVSNPSETSSDNKNHTSNPLDHGEGGNSVQVAEKNTPAIETSETPPSDKNKGVQAHAVGNAERQKNCGFLTKFWPLIRRGGENIKKGPFNELLPENLKKLELQCFPDPELPEWLKPENLRHLERLYIKGGTELTGLGDLPKEPTQCAVKVLRLKFLPKLIVEWRDLEKLYFPKLLFLEKYQCPRVTFCPCDGMGIWSSKGNEQSQEIPK